MCAICGVLNWKNQKEIQREDIQKMQAALRHRGPDGSQMLMLDGAALGFDRLSFLDHIALFSPESKYCRFIMHKR